MAMPLCLRRGIKKEALEFLKTADPVQARNLPDVVRPENLRSVGKPATDHHGEIESVLTQKSARVFQVAIVMFTIKKAVTNFMQEGLVKKSIVGARLKRPIMDDSLVDGDANWFPVFLEHTNPGDV